MNLMCTGAYLCPCASSLRSGDRAIGRFGALFGCGGWRHLVHDSWVGVVAGFDQRRDVAFPYEGGHNG